MTPQFFETAQDLAKWFRANQGKADELWIGFYKKASGRKSITWEESVDEALCVGWIDGIRKSVDEISYKIRFTPRRRGSIWSAVNIRRVSSLTSKGLMQPSGVAAFATRKENKSGIYSYEQRTAALPEPYASALRGDRKAWHFFQEQSASYRKMMSWWIVSAKQESTRQKRLQRLLSASREGRRLR